MNMKHRISLDALYYNAKRVMIAHFIPYFLCDFSRWKQQRI